jgi:mRNA-degrading endonuclease YafQ of YafQ-DinJ toxin-antitoxin module
MKIIYSSKFAREYKKLPNNIKNIAEEQEIVFRQDPYDPQLKTHKLKGKLSGFLSFSIAYKYRIIFEFAQDKNTVYFHSVSDHDIYE